jgi:hypothetical protein
VKSTPFPRRAGSITAVWLSEMLNRNRAFGRGHATHVEIARLGGGVFGDVFRVRTRWAGRSPKTIRLVVKFSTSRTADRTQANRFGVYEREALFYRRLAPLASVRVPTCYAAEFDAASGESCLVLEDLSSWRSIDQTSVCSEEVARLALHSLAKFHAQFWTCSKIKSAHWIPSIADRSQLALLIESHSQALAALRGNPPSYFPASASTVAGAVDRHLESIVTQLALGAQTLLHGDFRLDNLFFSSSVRLRDCAIFDWQLLMKGNPGADVGYFLSQSVGSRLREHRLADLLSVYWTALRQHGVTDYSLAELWQGYRLGVLFGFTYAIHAAGGYEIQDARWAALARTIIVRGLSAIQQCNALSVIDDDGVTRVLETL